MHLWYDLGLVVVMAANLLSLAACGWMLIRLCKTRPAVRQRLFPTQLLHLNIADILVALSSMGYTIVNYHHTLGLNLGVGQYNCRATMWLLFGSFWVSIFIETQIAVGFACIVCRKFCVLACLRKAATPMWFVAFVMSSYSVMPSTTYADQGAPHVGCFIDDNGFPGGFRWVCIALLVSCLMTSFGCLLGAVYRVRGYPQHVRIGVWRTTAQYPFAAAVSFGPVVWYFMFWPDTRDDLVLFQFVVATVSLNGFINMVMYAYNSRYARRRPQCQNGEDVEDVGQTPDSPRHLLSEISWHVGINSMASSIHVSRVQGEAAARSEREAREIAQMRGTLTSSEGDGSFEWHLPTTQTNQSSGSW